MRIKKESKTKNLIMRVISVSQSTFTRYMNTHKEEILKLYPLKKKSSLLPPIVVDYLCETYGFTWEDIRIEEDKIKKSTT